MITFWVLAWQAWVVLALIGLGGLAKSFKMFKKWPLAIESSLVIGLWITSIICGVLLIFKSLDSYSIIGILVLGTIGFTLNLWHFKSFFQESFSQVFSRVLLPLLVLPPIVAFSVVNHWWVDCDDNNYAYLAKRIWSQGDIFDPFNSRRTTGLSFNAAIQAIVLGPFSSNLLHAVDLIFGTIVLFLAINRINRQFATFITASIVLSNSLLGGFNATPLNIPTALSLFAISTIYESRSTSDNKTSSRESWLLVGIVIGLLIILRQFFAIPLLVLCLVILIVSRKLDRRLYSFKLLQGIASTLLPWMALQFKDTGTIMYPLFNGNMNPSFPYMGPTSSISVLHQLEISLIHILKSNILQVLIISTVALFYLSRKFGTNSLRTKKSNGTQFSSIDNLSYLPFYLVKLILSFLISYFVLSVFLRGWDGPWAYTRYWTPFLVALLIFATLVIVRDVITPNALSLLNQRFFSFWWVLSIFCMALQLNLPVFTSSYIKGFESLSSGEIGRIALSDPIRENSKNLRKAIESIAVGSKVFVATEYPVGFLDRGFDFQFADIVGAASRGEYFPFFKSFETKVEWLKGQKFDYVVFSEKNAESCLFSNSTWEASLGQNTMTGVWAPYVLDWISFLNDLSMKHPQAVSDYDKVLLLAVGKI